MPKLPLVEEITHNLLTYIFNQGGDQFARTAAEALELPYDDECNLGLRIGQCEDAGKAAGVVVCYLRETGFFTED
jgi:hypothetical protein